MTERHYTVGQLRRLIKESASEFKPVVGNGVWPENVKDSKKAYGDAEKKSRALKGGVSDSPEKKVKYVKNDYNRTMLGYSLDGEAPEGYRERVQAQAEGYTSDIEKKNGIEKDPSADFSGNRKFYDAVKKTKKDIDREEEELKRSGLTARTAPAGKFRKEDFFKESRKLPVLNFKKTAFLSESDMKTRIPDEYKTEGSVFRMRDRNGNSYLVEWTDGKAEVRNRVIKEEVDRDLGRIRTLFGYRPGQGCENSTARSRMDESGHFSDIMEKARRITESEE